MKRIAVLALVCAFVMAWAGGAVASELKAKGSMQVEGVWMDNWDFRSMKHGAASEDDFEVAERARISFEFIANENLKGVVQLQIGTGRWGNGGFTIGQGDGGVGLSTSLRTRQAYLTFNWPDTDVSITGGYFTVALPGAATGNTVLDEEAAALAISAPIIEDRLSALLVYSRAIDLNLGYGLGAGDADGFTKQDDEYDVFALALPITFDGISFTPYGVYGHAGKDALNGQATGGQGGLGQLRGLTPVWLTNDIIDAGGAYTSDVNTWWGGFAFELTMFDPIWVGLDFVYGSATGGDMEFQGIGLDDAGDRKGWYVDFAIRYDGLDMVQPKLFFSYGSGDDDDAENGSERMPFLDASSRGFGSFYYGYGSSFAAADMSSGTGNDSGQWVLGLGLEQITFMDKLSQDFYVMYVQGTNDHKYVEGDATAATNPLWGYYLTDKDYLIELDLNTKYQIYEELSAILELGYIVAHFDDDVWGIDGNGDNAFKCALGLKYSF